MSSTFEGDLVRPLGVVTLNFGYLEAQVNQVILMLDGAGVSVKVPAGASLGLRLKALTEAVQQLQVPAREEILSLLEESQPLVSRRNDLVHAAIYTGGRVVPNTPGKAQYRITPESLEALADQASSWKGRLDAAVQRRLLPELRR